MHILCQSFSAKALPFALPFSLGRNLSATKTIEVHGHRGARARFPENTLPAFSYAIDAGVDVLEMDMGVTKDNVIVISHDQSISPKICLDANGKTLSGPILIHTLTLSEIKKFDCGALKNPRFPKQTLVPGTRIPTLEEVFDLVLHSKNPHAPSVRFNIETKINAEFPNNTVDPATFVDLFLKIVSKYGLQDRVILQSFDFRTLEVLRQKNPKILRAALTESRLKNSVDIAKSTQSQILSPVAYFVDANYVQRLHNIGVTVVPWTANERVEWARLVIAGVDGIISDDPEALIQYLKEKGLR